MILPILDLIVQAYGEALRFTESPFHSNNPLLHLLGHQPRVLHRDYLTRTRYNVYGEPIPPIWVVVMNLRRLGPRHLDPRRLR